VRIFVTGWNGLVGSSLVPLLQARHAVEGSGVEDADIGDRDYLRNRLDSFRPDLVVHLAAMTQVDRCEAEVDEAFRVNAEGSRVVATEAERVEAAVLSLSTDYVFDGSSERPYRETDDPRPLSVYGRSKHAGEEAVRGAATKWTIVRSAWLFGRGGANFVTAILGALETRDTVRVVDDQRGSPTYAHDLAHGISTLIERRARGLYHLVNAGTATWFELAREAARLQGLDPDRVHPAGTEEIGRPAPRPAYSVLAAELAAERFGVSLRPWPEALGEYLQGAA
jgi:dTDP-4-dehydrorhamnose reductase